MYYKSLKYILEKYSKNNIYFLTSFFMCSYILMILFGKF